MMNDVLSSARIEYEKTFYINPEPDRSPVWSPDGSLIAFESERDGNPEVYVTKPDGTGVVRLTSRAAADYAPAWSPDGSLIAFSSGGDILVVEPDGRGERKITGGPAVEEY